jgi:hypothetical protein
MKLKTRPGGAAYLSLLGGVMALFIGILACVWYGSAKANPVILDEHGHVRGSHHP